MHLSSNISRVLPPLGLSCAFVMSLFAGVTAAGAAGPRPVPASFQFEQQAQNHCPGQAVVWVDPNSRTYDLHSDRFYGLTRTGVYACVREAETAGFRAKRKP
jgi:hypothetical protein